jgi:hypothetical protein
MPSTHGMAPEAPPDWCNQTGKQARPLQRLHCTHNALQQRFMQQP